MGYIGTNITAILAATFAGLVIGALYWLASRRRQAAENARPRWAVPFVALVAEFWLACILAGALILAPSEANPWVMAIGSAVVIWIGFVVPALTTSFLFHRLRPGTLSLDLAHWLAVMVLQAAVLHTIGLVRV